MNDDWQADALCLGADPNAMQPERATAEHVEKAKAVCFGCPVFDQCRELAESQVGDGGVLTAYGVHAGQWYGHPPVPLFDRVCEHCGEPFRTEREAQTFCAPKHRVAAARSREHCA